ncbi:hypothetical protein ACYPKM_01040 [Pseudomonas aeruginosa]
MDITEDDLRIMAEHNHAMNEYYRKEGEQRTAVLNEVRALVTPEVFAEIEEAITDSEQTTRFEIVDQAVGEPQDDGYSFQVYINQTLHGGHTGDDFAGTVCIPLPDGRFLKFEYSM